MLRNAGSGRGQDGDCGDVGAVYWEGVFADWQRGGGQPLWRACSDAVHERWLSRCLPFGRYGVLLKTDLFDEAFGAGLYPFLEGRGWRVVGVDTSARATAIVRARYAGLQTALADVRRLPFAEGSFDVVVSNSTLDHFAREADLVQGLT
ncbi:MAG: class I SAM-dependent methyltransferase [Anaerolineae bacterium]